MNVRKKAVAKVRLLNRRNGMLGYLVWASACARWRVVARRACEHLLGEDLLYVEVDPANHTWYNDLVGAARVLDLTLNQSERREIMLVMKMRFQSMSTQPRFAVKLGSFALAAPVLTCMNTKSPTRATAQIGRFM